MFILFLTLNIAKFPCGVPEPNWVLNSKLILESAQRRSCVVGPVTPGASSQTILFMGTSLKSYHETITSYDTLHTCHASLPLNFSLFPCASWLGFICMLVFLNPLRSRPHLGIFQQLSSKYEMKCVHLPSPTTTMTPHQACGSYETPPERTSR